MQKIQQPTRKFTEVLNVSDWEVLTDTGYQPIQHSNVTVPYKVWKLETTDFKLECADDHIVFDNDYNEVFVKDLKKGTLIQTENGPQPIISVEELAASEPMYDLTLPEGTDHRYYTGGILSHNTTVGVDLIANLHLQGKKVLFISAEMNQIDMSRYLKRFPHWGKVPMLFMADYADHNSKDVIESILNEGWDLVFTDSFSEVCDTVKEDCGMTRGAVEKWFLQLMDQNNIANNIAKKYTTFMTILQVGKSGIFSGSNKLKHMSTAMVHLEWEGSENSGRRFMYFSKNRSGDVGKKLYYDLNGGVTFDEDRYTRDLFNDELLIEERKALDSESSAFDKLFGFANDGVPAELKTSVEI